MQHNMRIDAEPMAVRIETGDMAGNVHLGTGFFVSHVGRLWLVTCRHNLEYETTRFKGKTSAAYAHIVKPYGAILLLDNRNVVGVRLGGEIIDAAAIEITDKEMASFPTSTWKI